MKTLILTIAATGLVLMAANAGKTEEITVTGDVKCAHCDLSIKSSCQDAIQTTDNAIFLLDGKIAESFFDENEGVKKVTATGTAKKQDDHTLLKVTKIEVAKG